MTYKSFTIKKKSGKLRNIVSPSEKLKKYQRGTLAYLTGYFKSLEEAYPEMNGIFHGFVPNRNAVTAAKQHIGYKATIMMDITDFFDNIKLKEHFEDPLKKTPDKHYVPTLTDKQKKALFHHDGYTPQGFATSPMLCNIALFPIMTSIRTALSTCLGDDFVITVYADDIQISMNKQDHETLTYVIQTVTTYLKLMGGLEINKNKTRIRYAKHGARRILGLNVWDSCITATRKTNRKVRAVKHLTTFDSSKGQALGGLKAWQKCTLPKAKRSKWFIR